MNWDVDELLDMVDEWKFKLHDKLKKMTAKQRAAFWRRSRDKARAMGLTVVEQPTSLARPKRRRRATG
ncbi:MAG TPA: hypothetical protein VKI65_00360 [Gemmataceae bacterium]|nr:hypothetical protein [Gemmataceae bacterium]